MRLEIIIMSSKQKKRIMIFINILFLLISFIIVFLIYRTLFFDFNTILVYIVIISYAGVSVILSIIHWHLSKEFRVEKELKRLNNIFFDHMETVLSFEYVKKILLKNKYTEVNESTFYAKVEHNFGDPTWTDYLNIKVLNVDTISDNLINFLDDQSMKGINTYNLVLFMTDMFDEESKEMCIQYIKSWLINYRTSYLKNGKGYALAVYEKQTNRLYYYKDKSRLHAKYYKSMSQLLKLL